MGTLSKYKNINNNKQNIILYTNQAELSLKGQKYYLTITLYTYSTQHYDNFGRNW